MSDEITVRHVQKLDGTNFPSWKFQLSAVFIAAGVSDVVNGSRVMPAAATWQKDNAKAMVLISTSVEMLQLESLITCKTAKEMWDALCLVHEQKFSSNKLFLMQKFHEYKMPVGDSIVQHVARLKNMGQQLKDVGEPVSNTTIMAQILASLASKYSAFQTVWDNVEEHRQTTENLTEKLIREEARFAGESDATEALVAVKSSGVKNKSPSSKTSEKKSLKKDIKCFKCNAKRHFARECSLKKKKNFREKRDENGTRDCAL